MAHRFLILRRDGKVAFFISPIGISRVCEILVVAVNHGIRIPHFLRLGQNGVQIDPRIPQADLSAEGRVPDRVHPDPGLGIIRIGRDIAQALQIHVFRDGFPVLLRPVFSFEKIRPAQGLAQEGHGGSRRRSVEHRLANQAEHPADEEKGSDAGGRPDGRSAEIGSAVFEKHTKADQDHQDQKRNARVVVPGLEHQAHHDRTPGGFQRTAEDPLLLRAQQIQEEHGVCEQRREHHIPQFLNRQHLDHREQRAVRQLAADHKPVHALSDQHPQHVGIHSRHQQHLEDHIDRHAGVPAACESVHRRQQEGYNRRMQLRIVAPEAEPLRYLGQFSGGVIPESPRIFRQKRRQPAKQQHQGNQPFFPGQDPRFGPFRPVCCFQQEPDQGDAQGKHGRKQQNLRQLAEEIHAALRVQRATPGGQRRKEQAWNAGENPPPPIRQDFDQTMLHDFRHSSTILQIRSMSSGIRSAYIGSVSTFSLTFRATGVSFGSYFPA